MPPKPKVNIPSGEHVDEVSMMDFENTRGSSNKSRTRQAGAGFSEMMGEEDDDDEEEGGAGGQRVECNTH